MKYKVGDKVRIKSLDWYNANKDAQGYINRGTNFQFTSGMSEYCGAKAAIAEIFPDDSYAIDITKNLYSWKGEYFEEENPVSEVPIVNLSLLKLSNNCFRWDDRGWKVVTLIQYCKEQNYPEFDLPLAGIRLDVDYWNISNLQEFVEHAYRMNKTSLDYPILLDSSGAICDGVHRVAKAIVEGRSTIKAIRIQEMPEPDWINDIKEGL